MKKQNGKPQKYVFSRLLKTQAEQIDLHLKCTNSLHSRQTFVDECIDLALKVKHVSVADGEAERGA